MLASSLKPAARKSWSPPTNLSRGERCFHLRINLINHLVKANYADRIAVHSFEKLLIRFPRCCAAFNVCNGNNIRKLLASGRCYDRVTECF